MPPFDDVLSSATSRRRTLQALAALGVAAPAMKRAKPVGAAPAPGPEAGRIAAYQADAATLVVGLDGAPSDRDPHSQYDFRSTVVIRSVYDGLIGLKGSSTEEFEPQLAESWESNEDGSVWTFAIRPDVTFHNGDPCDANAIKASYERLLAMKKGAFGVVARFVTDPAMMTAPDPLTLVFDLGQPQPLFPTAMAATYGPQVVNVNVTQANEEVGDDGEGDFGNFWLQTNSEGAGTGPWIVTEADPSTGIIMERNPTYWGGWEGEHLERVVIRVVEEAETMRQLLEAGDVDIIDTSSVRPEAIPELEQNPDLTIDSSDSTEVEYYTMTVSGPLATAEARQALCMAFPYAEVLDGVYLGRGTQPATIVAPSVRGYDPDVPAFATDLDRARELLATAGVAEGTELTAMLAGGSNTTPTELFQANLAELGITLTIETVDQATRTATFYGDAPAEERPSLMLWSWWPDYNDAWNTLQPTLSCDSWGSAGANGGLYCNEAFDDLLEDAKNASTLDTYATVLAEAQEIVGVQDPPVIAYVQPKWNTAYNKRVQGFFFNAINLGTYDFYKLSKTG